MRQWLLASLVTVMGCGSYEADRDTDEPVDASGGALVEAGTGGADEPGSGGSAAGGAPDVVTTGGAASGGTGTGGEASPSGGAQGDGGSLGGMGGEPASGGSGGCVLYYEDADRDGFGNHETENCSPGGIYWVTNGDDCYDANSLAHPTELDTFAQYHDEDRGDGSFDYNCDGEATPYWGLAALNCGDQGGFTSDTIPDTCGGEGYWVSGGCLLAYQRQQVCR